MKVTLSRDKLLEALLKVQNVVERKNTMLILSNLLLNVSGDKLTVSATDLDVGIEISLFLDPKHADDEDGSITISARNLLDIVRELPNHPVTLTKRQNNWIEIFCQKSTFNLAGMSSDEFPPLPSFENKNYVPVNAAMTREMIDKTVFAVSTDETRHHMIGVFFQALENKLIRMFASDGHRLAFVDKELLLTGMEQLRKGFILSRKGLTELKRLLEGSKDETFFMALEKTNVLFRVDKVSLFIRLIEGDYPNYDVLIPKNTGAKVVINSEVFMGSLRRVSLLSNERNRGVKFRFEANELVISSSNPELGDAKEIVDIEYGGPTLDVAFNARYIIEFLSTLEGETVSFGLTDRLSPGILRPLGKDDYTYVVMPMRI